MAANTNLMTLLTHDLESQQPSCSALQGFLLVDGSARAEVIQHYFLLEKAPHYLPLFLGMTDETLNQSPYLIQIQETSGDYLQWLSHEYPGLAFAFTSCLSLDEQLRFWQSLLLINTGAESPCYFRFYDGHVARQLYVHGSLAERRELFQWCHHLYFQNEHHEWQAITLPHRHPQDERNCGVGVLARETHWFTLSQETLQRVAEQDPAIRQRILNLWWQHYPHLAHQLTHEEVLQYAAAAQQRFHHYQIHSWQQQALFACLMMEYGPDFDQHPDIAQLFLEEQSNRGERFGDRAMTRIRQQFSPAWWQTLKGCL